MAGIKRGRRPKHHLNKRDAERFRELLREGIELAQLSRIDLTSQANAKRLEGALRDLGFEPAFITAWWERIQRDTLWRHALEDQQRPLPVETAYVLVVFLLRARPRRRGQGIELGQLPVSHPWMVAMREILPAGSRVLFAPRKGVEVAAFIPPESFNALAEALAAAAIGALPLRSSSRTALRQQEDLAEAFRQVLSDRAQAMAEALFMWERFVFDRWAQGAGQPPAEPFDTRYPAWRFALR